MNLALKMSRTYSKSLFQNLPVGVTKKEEIKEENIITQDDSVSLPQIDDRFLLGEELTLIRTTLLSSTQLSSVFRNPTYLEKQKASLLLELFPGLSVTMKSFLQILAEKSHLSFLPMIQEEYEKLLFEFQKITMVQIITASILKKKIGNTLLKQIRQITGSQQIVPYCCYNPTLLGGFCLEYNSLSVDASFLREVSLFFTNI